LCVHRHASANSKPIPSQAKPLLSLSGGNY
jgi:hypothetical protein